MGILTTITEILKASTQSTDRGTDGRSRSEGAFWCHECNERVLDVDVEGQTPPSCPACAEAMTFERSPGSTGCAC